MKCVGLFLLFAAVAVGAGDLVRIGPADADAVRALSKMNLPIYCQMEDVYIGVLDSRQTSQLEDQRIEYQVICQVPSEGNFYIVTPGPTADLNSAALVISSHCRILLEHAGSFFVVGEPQLVERLPQLRFRIARVNRRPIVLERRVGPAPGISPKYNPVVKWVIDQITVGEVAQLVRDLSGENPVTVGGRTDTITSRFTYVPKNSVSLKYYYEKIQSFGVDSVIYHPFDEDSNVVGTRIGRVYPRQQYLIGGHIDNTSETPDTYAPGADDNATGTVAGLIAARYIRGIPFKRTLKFVAWNMEEQGLVGSEAYAMEAAFRGDSIIGYLNADMIGYQSSGASNIRIYNGNRPGSITLSSKFNQMNTDYSIGLAVRISTQAPTWSDHYSFWIYGYDAICAIEYEFNPYYHTTMDRINVADTVFFCKVVKCLVATLLELAEPDTLFPGIEEQTAEARSRIHDARLRIFPNPFRNRVTITLNSADQPISGSVGGISGHQQSGLNIYDASGRTVRRFDYETMRRSDQIVWDGRDDQGVDLPAGVYFMKLADRGGEPARVVKIK